jgi:hypothetical protein
MALVLLPGLNNLIEDISDEKKLSPQVVEAALREALPTDPGSRARDNSRAAEVHDPSRPPLPHSIHEQGGVLKPGAPH